MTRSRGRSGEAENPFWLTYSDLLSSMVLLLLVLLVIFIQISQQQQRELEEKLLQLKKNQELLNKAGRQSALIEFDQLQTILQELESDLSELAPKLKEVSHQQVDYRADRLEFSVGSQLLFDLDKRELKTGGKKVLSQIVPLIAKVVTKEKYEKVVAGIIFEGRADLQGNPKWDWNENYTYNLNLTQERAAEVIKFVFGAEFNQLLKGQSSESDWQKASRERLRRKIFSSGRSNIEAILELERKGKSWKSALNTAAGNLKDHRQVVIRLQLYNILGSSSKQLESAMQAK